MHLLAEMYKLRATKEKEKKRLSLGGYLYYASLLMGYLCMESDAFHHFGILAERLPTITYP